MPVVVHPLVFARNHVFVRLPEGLFLVDTGSPATFGDSATATLGERPVAISRGMAGIAMPAIRTLAGPDCVGLLGMDLLGRSAFRIDGPAATLTTGLQRSASPGAGPGVLPNRPIGALPVWSVRIAGVVVDAVFDTGAQYGYVVDAGLFARGAPLGEFDDFHPYHGHFRAPVARFDVDLAGVVVRDRIGLATPAVAGQLRGAGVGAVLGCSWLQDVVVDVDGDVCRVARASP